MASLREFLPPPRNEPPSPERPSPSPNRVLAATSAEVPAGSGISSVITLPKKADGSADFTALARVGENASRVVHADHSAVVERPRDEALREALVRPDEAAEAEVAARTRAALEPIVQGKVAASHPSNFRGRTSGPPQHTAEFVRYTPASTATGGVPGKQRIVKMMQAPVDPMEPPRFSQKKTPHAPRSPPVPVLHSPERKLSKEEAANWVIPPSISNWKNNRGYTVPLDKRLASVASRSRDSQVNDKFAALAETMYKAERTAREQVEMRAQIQRNMSLKAKEAKEKELRELAARAREERAGISTGLGPSEAARDGAEASEASRVRLEASRRTDDHLRESTKPEDTRSSSPSRADGIDSVEVGVDTAKNPSQHSRLGSAAEPAKRSRVSRFGDREGRDRGGQGDIDGGLRVGRKSEGLTDEQRSYLESFKNRDEWERRESFAEQRRFEIRDARQRDEIRRDLRRQRDRELRRREVHGDEDDTRPTLKRSKLSRDRDRDISERIALGLYGCDRGAAGEVAYDQRLFNQGGQEGMRSGFGGEDADVLYDRPLFEGGRQSRFQYHPQSRPDANGNADGDEERGTARFKPDRALGQNKDASGEGGSGAAGPRTRPVEFEREVATEPKASDPFGLNDMQRRMAGAKK